MPTSFTAGQPIAQLQGAQLRCFGPQHRFRRFGQSGQEIAEIFPHIGSIADDICIVRSMQTEQIKTVPLNGRNYQDLVLLTPETWRDPEGRGTVLVSGRLRQFTSGVCL